MAQNFSKFRKVIPYGVAVSGATVSYGKIGLKASSPGRITAKQIEAARMVITRACNRIVKLVIRIAATLPVSKKPLEVRMGGGKGPIELYVAAVSAGTILFELDNVPIKMGVDALTKASYKMPIDCKVVLRKFVKLS